MLRAKWVSFNHVVISSWTLNEAVTQTVAEAVPIVLYCQGRKHFEVMCLLNVAQQHQPYQNLKINTNVFNLFSYIHKGVCSHFHM